MDKKIQMSILSIFVAAALVGSIVAISGMIAPHLQVVIITMDHKKKKSNDALKV